MRKVIAIAISALMLISVFSVCVSAANLVVAAAPEGTAITSAADFAAMKADGKYYLSADIAVTATYTTLFTGTLDGNGHKISTTVAVFDKLAGTVKNLTLTGAQINVTGDFGVLANEVPAEADLVVLENIVNEVPVYAEGDLKYVGGLVGTCQTFEATFNNCVNKGSLTVKNTGSANVTTVGGIVGRALNGIFTKCSNEADISYEGINEASKVGLVGGLVGGAAHELAGANCCEFYACTNSGNITASDLLNGNNIAGGLVGHTGVKSNISIYTFRGCVNTGTVTANYQAGGLVGYVYATGSNANETFDIQYNINVGKIVAGTPDVDGKVKAGYAGDMVGYSNSCMNVMKYNICAGECVIENSTFPLAFLGCSSAEYADVEFEDNYFVNTGKAEYFTYASSDDNASKRYPLQMALDTGKIVLTTLADVKSGAVAKAINDITKGADGITFKEGANDGYPEIIMEVAAEPETTKAPETTKKPETTKAPSADTTKAPSADTTKAPTADTTAAPTADTTAAPKAEKSGCGSVLACSIALVAVFGSAVVLSKKH